MTSPDFTYAKLISKAAPLAAAAVRAEVMCALVGIHRAPANEKELQQEMARLFEKAGMAFAREVPTGFGPVDFVINRVAVEVKVDGSAVRIFRQLARYLRSEVLLGAVLVTTKPVTLPAPHVETVQGNKPIEVVPLWRQFL